MVLDALDLLSGIGPPIMTQKALMLTPVAPTSQSISNGSLSSCLAHVQNYYCLLITKQ